MPSAAPPGSCMPWLQRRGKSAGLAASRYTWSGRGLQGVDGEGEVGFVPVGGVFFERADADGDVDGRKRVRQQRLCRGRVAGCDGAAQYLDRRAHAAAVRAVHFRAADGLPDALQYGTFPLLLLLRCSLRHLELLLSCV